jgi:L-ascorbate metabolism protein UlaG (beta-lactamase superfamily)
MSSGARRAIIAAVSMVMATTAPVDAQRPDSGVTITFLANEGVLLSSGPRRVLIDALFLKYEEGYAVPADSTQVALAGGRAPFDADLLLVTHRHGDHFHPGPVAAHLRANPRATLITSRQVIDSLRHHLNARELRSSRIMARSMTAGTIRRESVNGIGVQLLGLRHGGRRHRGVEHLGYVVELGGRRVLHVGDTDTSEEAFAPLRLDTARIDVALLPVWMVTSAEGKRVIERWIRPRQVLAFHLGEGDTAKDERAVRAAIPGAVTLKRSLDVRRW